MKTDIDFLIDFMERYTKKSNSTELDEQEASQEKSQETSGDDAGKATKWSDIVGANLKRGPANPIKNEPMADRVTRSGPANQISSKTKHSDIVKPARGPANQLT